MDGAATTQTSAGSRALQIMVQGHIVFVSVLMTVTFAGGILLWLRSRKKLQQYTVIKWIQRKIYMLSHRMRGRNSVMEAYELQALEEAQNTQPEAAVAVLNSESDEDTDVENFLVEVHKPFTSCPSGALFLPADSRSGDSEQSSRNEGPERDSRGLGRGRRRRTDAPVQKSSDIDTNDCDENMTSPTFNTHPKGARRKSPQKLNLVKDTSAEKSVSSWTPCSSLLAGVKTRADKNAYSSQPETSDSDNDYYSEVQDSSWAEGLNDKQACRSLLWAMTAKGGGYRKPTLASTAQVQGSACNSPATIRNADFLKINSPNTSQSSFCTTEHHHHYPAKSPDMQQKQKDDSVAKRNFGSRLLQSDYSEVDDDSDAEPEGVSNLQGELIPTRLTFSGSQTSSDSHYSEVNESDTCKGTSNESIDISNPHSFSESETGEFEVNEGDESHSSSENDGNYDYSEVYDDYVNEANIDDDSGDDTVKIGCRVGGWEGRVGVRPSLGDVGSVDDEKATVRHCGEDCYRPVITERACRQLSRDDCGTQVEQRDPAAETQRDDDGVYVNARSERLCCVSDEDVSNYQNVEEENGGVFQSDYLATATTSVVCARRNISPSTAKSASHGNYLTPASGPDLVHDGEMDDLQDSVSISSFDTCTDTEEGQVSIEDTGDLCAMKGDRNREGDENFAEGNETGGEANYMNLEEEFNSTNSLNSQKLSMDRKSYLKHTVQKQDTSLLFQPDTKVQILGQRSAGIPLSQSGANSRVSRLKRDTTNESNGGVEVCGHNVGEVSGPLATFVSTTGTSGRPDEPVASDYSKSDYQNVDTRHSASDYFNNEDLRSAMADEFPFSSSVLGHQAFPGDTGFGDKRISSDATSISTESDDAGMNGFEHALGRLDTGGVCEVVTNYYTILK